MAVAEASPVGRRFLDLRLVDVTRPPPGPLCWLAAIGFSGGLLIAAVLSAHASGFLVAALLAAMSGLFLLRPLAATVLVIVIHQSVDLWANGQLESIGGLQFNLTTGLTLLVVLVGGAYVAERWDAARRAPSVLAFLVFAAIATVSLVHAPALTQGIPEVLRIVRIGVVYTLVFVLVRSRRDIEMILMAQFALDRPGDRASPSTRRSPARTTTPRGSGSSSSTGRPVASTGRTSWGSSSA